MEHHTKLLTSLALGLITANAVAQNPEDPPPWWGVQDNVTVSLSWTFDTAFPNGQPDPVPSFAVTPAWYNNPSPWTASNNVTWIANLGGQQGVCGLIGNGTATLDLFVDNDPHLDWVKIFFFQFDSFEGAGGEITNTIQESLQDYGRASVTKKTRSLSNGWERTTVTAKLIPQPNDEEIDFVLIETLSGTIGIDNLHVSSKCEKPRPDETGDALGKILGVTNLSLAIGGRRAGSLAITRGNAINPGRRLWVAVDGFTPTSPIEIVQLSSLGLPTGIVSTLQVNAQQAPLGPLDMDAERIRTSPTTWQEWIYVLIDSRPSGGSLRIEALNANTSTPSLSQSVQLIAPPFTANQRMGLAFDPSGDSGAGTFWVAGQTTTTGTWRAVEFDRTGALTNATLNSFDVPPETAGLTYDATLGNFYCFSANTTLSPGGTPIRSNGTEISGFDGLPTGVKFCGDLNLQPAGGVPAGGIASALSMYRTFTGVNSQIQFTCIADFGTEQYLYELAGPFRYGYSRYGTCGMQNGPPFLGGNFDITLSGVPNSLFAVMFLGSDSDNTPLSPGIQAEAVASILPPLVSSNLLTPISTGEFAFSISLPPTPALAYTETFFQWIVLDTTAPGFLGFSQAGKTVIYP
jgi:hypothetical protein